MHLKYDHYYRHSELVPALEFIVQQHKDIATLERIGKSGEGRDLLAVSITNSATGDPSSKPALYIDCNHHAGECVGTMTALYTIDHLLSRRSATSSRNGASGSLPPFHTWRSAVPGRRRRPTASMRSGATS